MRLFLLISFALFFFASSAQTVHKTPSGKRYHIATCRMVKNVSEAIDVKEAVEEGLGPCIICSPLTPTAQMLLSKDPLYSTASAQTSAPLGPHPSAAELPRMILFWSPSCKTSVDAVADAQALQKAFGGRFTVLAVTTK